MWGRRIEKKDLVDPNNTRRYYYNYNWQALCQYDGSGAIKEIFVYGNFIDEVLFKVPLFYMHDHLYSPVALVHWLGSVLERYEYDAYGNCYVMDASYNPRTKSSYGNPFYFTGREMDIFDSGNLKLYNYRHRYYDSYTGRFTTHDPLGYIDGMNNYEYVMSNPLVYTDPQGLFIGLGNKIRGILTLRVLRGFTIPGNIYNRLRKHYTFYDFWGEMNGLYKGQIWAYYTKVLKENRDHIDCEWKWVAFPPPSPTIPWNAESGFVGSLGYFLAKTDEPNSVSAVGGFEAKCCNIRCWTRKRTARWKLKDEIDANSYEELEGKSSNWIEKVLEGIYGDIIGDTLLAMNFYVTINWTEEKLGEDEFIIPPSRCK